MSEKFSPQAKKVIQELIKLSKGRNMGELDDLTKKRLLGMDPGGEVVVRSEGGTIEITRSALEKCIEAIAEVYVKEERVGKAGLCLVYSAPEKADKSDQKDGEPEELSKGDKAE